MIDMRPLKSSNLGAAGADGDDLVIEFRNGSVYRYPGAGGLLASLVAAPSAGKFFAETIRNAYPSKREQ